MSVWAGVAVEAGTLSDFESLAAFHYRAGPPAVVDRVLRMIVRTPNPRLVGAIGELIGVLVTARPTLNGAWRELAWPGRYRTGQPRRDAQRINDELRCIARVVIDPRWRGIGAGQRLVRAYLRAPATVCTEAIAVMGSACPFFAAAGMTAYRLPPTRRNARLTDALAHRAVAAADLLDEATRTRIADDPLLIRELRSWARSARASRRYLDAPLSELMTHAAHTITHRPIAYASSHAASPQHEEDATDADRSCHDWTQAAKAPAEP